MQPHLRQRPRIRPRGDARESGLQHAPPATPQGRDRQVHDERLKPPPPTGNPNLVDPWTLSNTYLYMKDRVSQGVTQLQLQKG